MIPPLVLSPKLQRRQREAALNPRGPLPNGGLTGDVGARPSPELRATVVCVEHSEVSRDANVLRRHPELSAIVPIPIPFGWSKVGRTRFYHFKEVPEDLLKWAQSEEVATMQERNTGRPCYVVVALPGSQSIYKYGSVMQQINRLYMGVVASESVELHHALLSARHAEQRSLG
jgi:hypothetical protein